MLDVPAAGPAVRPAAICPPATRNGETAASPILRGLLVGDPVGMLFRNHIEELDQTAAELRGLVVSAVTDSATRAEISEPQRASMKTALLGGCHAGDHGFAAVPSPNVGADVPDRGVAVIPAFTRGGSTA
jgi:hypothetical protein